ncbi:right-handed parallel beta-helix repeat-containing protein, partial [bacterium]|nr:right-handed parallel beta-helix repeat-containing protein [bacterium]
DIQGIGLLYSLIVTDNKIRNVQHGIYLRNELGYHNFLYDVIVANNHILDVSFDGVQIYTADRVTVEGNVVRTANRKNKSFGRGFTMREINELIFTGNMYSEDSGAPGGAESGVTFHTDTTYIAQNNIMLSLKETDSYNGNLSGNIVDGVQSPLRQLMIGQALADATSYYLPTGEAGWGFVQLGDNAAWASFSFTSAGVVTLIDNANANTDSTAGTLSVFDAGAGVGFKNHSGGSATLRALVHSSP